MNIHKQQLEQIRKDSRYRENIEWGSPRPGHPEGTVQKHILELESNLNALEPETTSLERDKLKLLIHVHDHHRSPQPRVPGSKLSGRLLLRPGSLEHGPVPRRALRSL